MSSDYLWCDCGHTSIWKKAPTYKCKGCVKCGTVPTRERDIHSIVRKEEWAVPGPKPVPHQFVYVQFAGDKTMCRWCKMPPDMLVKERLARVLRQL